MTTAVLGIIGTLAGTVLGWALNSLSQKGKLNFFVLSWDESYEKQDDYGGLAPSRFAKETSFASWDLVLDVHNSSLTPKIMRSPQIVFLDQNGNMLLSFKPKDSNTKRISGGRVSYNEIDSVNIPGKTVITMHMHNGIGNHNDAFNLIWKVDKVYLTYIDEKNTLKKVFVSSIQVDKYFKEKR